MGTNDAEGFICGGHKRLLDANRDKIKEIEMGIWERYAKVLAVAGALERIKIEAAIRRELKVEVDKIAPPDALH